MPTYEYECLSCKHRFEAFQPITAKALEKCPKCNGAVHRLISLGSGIIFKGSGFYSTDYRSSDYKKRKKEEEKPPSAPCIKADSSGKCDGCPKAKPKK